MEDLAAWLRLQLDEDERLARASAAEPHNFYSDGHYGAVAAFLDCWNPADPARVLAEVESKRQILTEHEHYVAAKDMPGVGQMMTCRRCGSFGLCATVKALAQPYADRPGFQESWRT